MEDNENLHNEVEQIKKDYKQKEFDNEWKYKSKIKGLEKENNRLHRIIDKFHDTIDKFIHWICKKFDMGAEDNLVRDFERENHIVITSAIKVIPLSSDFLFKFNICIFLLLCINRYLLYDYLLIFYQ